MERVEPGQFCPVRGRHELAIKTFEDRTTITITSITTTPTPPHPRNLTKPNTHPLLSPLGREEGKKAKASYDGDEQGLGKTGVLHLY